VNFLTLVWGCAWRTAILSTIVVTVVDILTPLSVFTGSMIWLTMTVAGPLLYLEVLRRMS